MYMVEYAAAPRIMEVACASGTMVAQGAHSCCDEAAQGEKCERGMQAGACHDAMRPEKKEQGHGPAKGCNPTAADCCLNCPLCYVMVLPTHPEKTQVDAVRREYIVWNSSYVYLYHTFCWKPPNAA